MTEAGRAQDDGMIITAPLFAELHAQLVDLLHGLQPEDWDRQTSAGSWQVRDVVAHMLDGDLRRISADRDGHAPPPPAAQLRGYDDLVAWLNALNAEWVASARRISPRLLVELLQVTGPIVARIMQAHAPYVTATFPVAWAGQGASPMWLDVGREFTERWHHQDQVREAVGAPPLDAPHILGPVIDVSLHALPHAFDPLDFAPGTAVEIETHGSATRLRWVVRGRATWRVEHTPPQAPPACRVAADALVLARLLLSRLSPTAASTLIRIEGDTRLARPLVAARAVMV
jgi:hypothetical protein